jgi:hypothetical protein
MRVDILFCDHNYLRSMFAILYPLFSLLYETIQVGYSFAKGGRPNEIISTRQLARVFTSCDHLYHCGKSSIYY